MTASRNRYSTVAILLHWVVAICMIYQLALGWRMADLPRGPGAFSLFQLHKSIGVVILLLALLRLFWRLTHRPPTLPASMPAWEQRAAQLTHAGFYMLLLVVPFTGWLLVSSSRTSIPTLLFGVVPWPHVPGLAGLTADARAVWHEVAELAHGTLALLFAGLLAMHLGAVLKHQLIERDGILGHMLPGAGRAVTEPRLWLALLLAAGLFAAGFALPRLPDAPAATPATELGRPQVVEQAATTGPLALAAADKAALSTPVPAVATPEAKPVADTAVPTVWQVQSGSTLNFTSNWSGAAIQGQFAKWQADIRFSPQALAASSLKVTVDIASLATGDAQRDAALPGDDWFDAGHFPQAVFTATHFRSKGGQQYVAEGTLELRGKRVPIALDFSLSEQGGLTVAKGSTRLDRLAFGIGQGEWAATEQIPAAVLVTFTVRAKPR